jgi:hypothetical protein
MKNFLFALFIIMSTDILATNSLEKKVNLLPTDTTVLPTIISINLNSYIGKPVDSLLAVLPSGYSNRGFMSVGAGYAKGLYQSYFSNISNNCAVEIYIDLFQFLPVPNLTPKSNWNMNLAKQETVAYIKVIKNNNVCVYGCNNPGYFH